MPFCVAEHTADLALKIESPTMEGLYEQAVEGVYALLLEGPVTERRNWIVEVCAEDREGLLFALLNEVIFRFSCEGMLLGRAAVEELSSKRIVVHGFGEIFNPQKHKLLRELKAATYHQLKIRRTKGRWSALVVFDV